MNLSIKNVPEDVVQALRERARRNHRSMQGELLTIVEGAVEPRKLRVWEVRRKAQELGLKTGDDSTKWVREDRDAR